MNGSGIGNLVLSTGVLWVDGGIGRYSLIHTELGEEKGRDEVYYHQGRVYYSTDVSYNYF